MQTIIIYDNTGKIIMTQSGNITIPESVAMVVADVPEGKMVESVDIGTGVPVLEDIPKTPEQQRFDQLEQVVNAMTGGTTE